VLLLRIPRSLFRYAYPLRSLAALCQAVVKVLPKVPVAEQSQPRCESSPLCSLQAVCFGPEYPFHLRSKEGESLLKDHFKKSLLAIAALAALALCFTPATASASTLKPDAAGCQASWVYDHITRVGAEYIGLGPTHSQYNPYSYTITASWSSTVSASVSVTASAGVSGDLSAIVAEVKADLGLSVSYTITVSDTVGVSVPVPSHETVYGQYSVERVKTSGHLYYKDKTCEITDDYGTVLARTPWHATWHLW
jgi:hypothetical protein